MKGQKQPVAVVLVNLGTPEAPTTSAVRGFLREFLSDPRVVEIPRFLWLIILNLFVLTFRPKPVSEAYKEIWTDRGSPIRWITEDQANGIRLELEERFSDAKITVTHAMTYGEPRIHETLDGLYQSGHRRIIVLPMYPQYSGSTTGAVCDQVASYMQRARAMPSITMINSYFYNGSYISALSESIRSYWESEGRGDHLLFSYHGIPESYVAKGDPYTGHCECTTGAVAAKLGLDQHDYTMAYQSRFGKAEWVKPYTDKTIEELASKQVKTLDVVCPAFSADCLETIEEIAGENAELFEKSGGAKLRLIPCLNASDRHIKALSDILSPHLEAIL